MNLNNREFNVEASQRPLQFVGIEGNFCRLEATTTFWHGSTLQNTGWSPTAMPLKKRILLALEKNPGITDRELTDQVLGPGAGQQAVNQAARALAGAGRLVRRQRPDGRIGNYPTLGDSGSQSSNMEPATVTGIAWPSEDAVKRQLQAWLEAAGWRVEVRWARGHGVDVDASRGSERWRIEVKGGGSLDAMRVNYFLAVLGELLQRMNDSAARYSVALPDMKQFRGLWSRLPTLAKDRTQITALFVAQSGNVDEVR